MNSDTALTGPILDVWPESTAPFLVEDEQQTDTDARRLCYDWDGVREIDSVAGRPAFVFNTGQWFSIAGVPRPARPRISRRRWFVHRARGVGRLLQRTWVSMALRA